MGEKFNLVPQESIKGTERETPCLAFVLWISPKLFKELEVGFQRSPQTFISVGD